MRLTKPKSDSTGAKPLLAGAATLPSLPAVFHAAMARFGPFEPNPTIAVAVSGGADSTALAVLAQSWTEGNVGTLQAFVVDHTLRPESAAEAGLTINRLAALGIPAKLFRLDNLHPGPALAERARDERYRTLIKACAEAGILHLLLGHHAADQVETLAMRVLRNSQTHGLAGIAALRETRSLRLLRPLLGIDPARLRHFLAERHIPWIEDPSNQNHQALRPRLRSGLSATPLRATGLLRAMSTVAHLRRREEAETAAELAQRASIHPEGFALLSPGRISTEALRRLVQTIAGAAYPPSPGQITPLAARPTAATVAGVRIMPAGRLGPGLLIIREEAAMAEAIVAESGAIWDSRFRLIAPSPLPAGAMVGALGSDAVRFRRASRLPSAILRTLPAVRIGKILAAVPRLGYTCLPYDLRLTILFSPPRPLSGPEFLPSGSQD